MKDQVINMNDTTIKNLAHSIASGVLSGDAGTLAIVAHAIRSGCLTFDERAADGKGRWNGTTAVVKSVFECTNDSERERVESVFTKSKVNKSCKVLTELAPTILDPTVVDSEEVADACYKVLGKRTLTSLYNELTSDDEGDKPWSLSQALGTVVTKARKEGIVDSTIVETLVAILSGE